MVVIVEIYIGSKPHWTLTNEVTMLIKLSELNVAKERRKIQGNKDEIKGK